MNGTTLPMLLCIIKHETSVSKETKQLAEQLVVKELELSILKLEKEIQELNKEK